MVDLETLYFQVFNYIPKMEQFIQNLMGETKSISSPPNKSDYSDKLSLAQVI